MSVSDTIGKVLYMGGSAVVQFNKNLGLLVKKWGILKTQTEKKIEKKRINSKEKTPLNNMIKGTEKILDEFTKDFSATNYSKSAIQTLVNKYDDKLLKALLGVRSCKEVSTKLKGLIRSSRNLASVSWATLSTYKPRFNDGAKGGYSNSKQNNGGRYSHNQQGQNKNRGPYPGQFNGYRPKSNGGNGQNGQNNQNGQSGSKNNSSNRF